MTRMTRPRQRALWLAMFLAAGLVAPAGEARAGVGLPAPVLVSPVGGAQPDVTVTFTWQRVTGAAGYRLRVHHLSADGPWHVNVETVNDTHVALVNYGGDVAWWQVAALDGSGDEGDWAGASFTTAALASTMQWPPDGTTINHPDEWPALSVDHVPGNVESIHSQLGSGEPIHGFPSRFGLGTWSWQVRSYRSPPDPITPSPSTEVRTFTYAWPGGTPTLLSPPNGHTLGPTEALRLQWASVPGAAMYHYELSKGGQMYRIGVDTRATWADILSNGMPNDLPAGTYEWRVRAIMSGTVGYAQYGPWSATNTVTIPGSPGTPSQTSPADGAALSSWPVLRWDPVPGAFGYAVETSDEAQSQAFPELRGASVNAISFFAAGDESNPNPMHQATAGTVTRYWRVRGQGTQYGIDQGEWSPWRSFTVTPSGAPLADDTPATRLGPADCSSDECPDLDGLPLLRWEPVPGAASYRVFIRWDGGVSGATNTWYDVGSTGLPMQTYKPATPTSRVSWNVLACPADGCSSGMPGGRSFFRVTFPAPVQTGPGDGTSQGGSVVPMSWVESGIPVQPDTLRRDFETHIEILVTPGVYGPTDRWSNYVRQPTYAFYRARGGQTVAWRVRAVINVGGFEWVGGAWSPWRTITRDVPAISIVSPADEAILASAPVLDWSALPGELDGYLWELAKLSTLEEMIAQHPQNEENYADRRETIGATSARLFDLAPGEYRWRVRPVGEGDGPWATRTFTITGGDAPQPVTPIAGATVRADDGDITWSSFALASESEGPCAAGSPPNATDQVVEVATSASFAAGSVVYRGCAERWTTKLPIPELLPTGDLYWRICAAFDCSPGRLLHVTPAPIVDAAAPTSSAVKVTPTLNQVLAADGGIPLTITWSASDAGTGIASQQLEVRRDSGAWTPIAVTAGARSATAVFRAGSTYSVRTRATDGAANVGGYATRTIQTRLREESSAKWSYSGSWTRVVKSSASGGALRRSPAAGATATTTTTALAFGLVAPRSTNHGNARIYIDGVYVATVKLDANPTGARRIVWATSWSTDTTRRITVRVQGTPGRPRVDLDALVILR